jgi:hypothetical protein
MIVADSNLIAYLLIPGGKSLLADEVFVKDSEWAIPLIYRSEMRNILAIYMRHEGMSLSQASRTMNQAAVRTLTFSSLAVAAANRRSCSV